MAARYEIIVMGTSAGGMGALSELLPAFPASYPLPIAIVQHVHPWQDDYFIEHYAHRCAMTVKEASEKEPIRPGFVYLAPPNYHLLIEEDHTFSLSVDERVNYARPSIDVLFDSAVDVYGPAVVGVVLTGANNDGAQGLRRIKARGGLAMVQDPNTAESSYMPKAAIEATPVDYVVPLAKMAALLLEVTGTKEA